MRTQKAESQTSGAQHRIDQKIGQIKREYGAAIVALLKDANKTHIHGRGLVSTAPIVEGNSLRWVLEWKEDKLSFDLNIVMSIEDNGNQAAVGKAWVHRHAASEFDFEGHTPTTRMKRLTGLSITRIREAIEAEFK